MAEQVFDIKEVEAQLFEKIQSSKAETVNERLSEIREWFLTEKAPKEMEEGIRGFIKEIAAMGIEEQALKAGQTAPDFTLPNAKGERVSLSESLKEGPVVVVFYRGAWCPYCNIYLGGLAQLHEEFTKRGVKVLAVSPQVPEVNTSFAEERQFPFEVLSDVGNKVAENFNLVYGQKQNDYVVNKVYPAFGIDLKNFNGDDSWELALPGTYVIDQNSEIRYAFAPADYTQRAEYAEVFEALDKLSAVNA